MTSILPSGAAPSSAQQGEILPPATQLSWEGDKMFNIYIYDYCRKRGFWKTARELLAEADLSADSNPPINAKQGLLFEWWSVFWVLFTAKSNGTGTDDALVYTQHQAQLNAQRQQLTQRLQQPNRYLNGVSQQRPGLLPNGQLPNGVGPNPLPGAPPLAGSAGPAPFPMAPGPQLNGMPPSAQHPNYQPLLPGQRPGGPQRRDTNGAPFHSPIMDHSQTPNVGGPGQTHPPALGQIGPSPHNRGSMLPPNGPQMMVNPTSMGGGQQVPVQGSFQQRPTSRTGSPLPNPAMAQPSPSLAARQAEINEISRIPPGVLTNLKQEAGLADKDINAMTVEEKQRILSLNRRNRPVAKPAQPGGNNAAAGPSGANSQMQLPNNRGPLAHIGPGPGPQSQRVTKRNSTSPGEDHETLRTDASPPERKRVRRSPMEQQQQSQSQTQTQQQQQHPQPPQQPPQPMTPLTQNHPAPPPGGVPTPQHVQNSMMRQGVPTPMNSFPSPMPYLSNAPMNMQVGQGMPPQGPPAMSPGMTHPVGGMMAAQPQYSNNMRFPSTMPNVQNMPKPGTANTMPGTIGSPASADSAAFNAGGQPGQLGQFPVNRMNQPNKPMGIMSNPSPSMSGPKEQAGLDKTDGSPRNVPQNAQTPGQATPNGGVLASGATIPTTPGGPSSTLAGPPSATLSNAPGTPLTAQGPLSANMDMSNVFSTDFMQSVASSLDEFDPTMFADRDLNFERDFGEWFNPDTSLDIK